MPLAVQRQSLAVQEKYLWIAGGIAVVLFIGPQIARWLTEKVGSAAGGIIVEGATGLVIGVGKSVGIPETDAALCESHLAAGDYWQASFYCPAGTFLKASWGAIINPRTGEEIGRISDEIPEWDRMPQVITIEPLPGTSPGEGQVSDWPAA